MLAVLYLLFNEGYSATSGADLVRQGLCADAIRLARTLAELMPDEPEARRPPRADAPARRPPRRARRRHRRRWCRSKSRTARSGTGPASTKGSRCWRRRCGDASRARTRCRRPSPRATPPRASRARPTGSRSPRSTASWRGWCRRRWWSSTARSRWRWPTVPTRGCASSTRSRRRVRSTAITCCPRPAPICLRRLDRNAEAAVAYREALELTATDAERSYLNRRLDETLGRAAG